jgi:hypothetical protein
MNSRHERTGHDATGHDATGHEATGHGQDREERALEALLAAALRGQEVDGMTFEKLLAFENDLTREDRAAIDALSPRGTARGLVDRIVSSHPSKDETLRGSDRSVVADRRKGAGGVCGAGRGALVRSPGERFPGESKGAKGANVMKSLILSVLVISGTAAAIVIGTRGDGPAGVAGLGQETADLLVSRLDRIEHRLDRLDELEDRVDRLASRAVPAKGS